MTRYSDWQLRLDVFLWENRARKFAYGSWDCCLFVADAIQAMTGVDLAAPFRGQYDSLRSALSQAKKACGVRSIPALVQSIAVRNRLSEVAPNIAFRGDMLLVKQGARDYCLGLMALDGRDVIITSSAGLWRVSPQRAVRAWRV